jgi:hypothetical protein
MPVIVWCAGCGAGYPSRMRARSGGDFTRLNPHLGEVLEPCPACGSREFRGSADREWRDPSRPVGTRIAPVRVAASA